MSVEVFKGNFLLLETFQITVFVSRSFLKHFPAHIVGHVESFYKSLSVLS